MTPGFTGSLLDRADHLRERPEAIAEMASSLSARLLVLDGLDPVLDDDGALTWTSLAEAAADSDLVFLGLEDGKPRFAELARDAAPGGPAFAMFRTLALMPADQAATYAAARSVIDWHARHRFCASCGHATEARRAGWGRGCAACGAEHFPRVDPVVIMLAEHGGRVLVGRQPRFPAHRYSALAGFVEPGESLEEAVARELFEEAGVRVRAVRYVASQPWPFPSQLMIACVAEAADDALTLDPRELEDAFWASRDEVAAALAGEEGARFIAPPPYAIAHTLLARWVDQAVAGDARSLATP